MNSWNNSVFQTAHCWNILYILNCVKIAWHSKSVSGHVRPSNRPKFYPKNKNVFFSPVFSKIRSLLIVNINNGSETTSNLVVCMCNWYNSQVFAWKVSSHSSWANIAVYWVINKSFFGNFSNDFQEKWLAIKMVSFHSFFNLRNQWLMRWFEYFLSLQFIIKTMSFTRTHCYKSLIMQKGDFFWFQKIFCHFLLPHPPLFI